MKLAELVASTSDPAFAVDLEGVILAWNTAAEETLGYRRAESVGRHCWEVLKGRDVYGNRYCGEHCPRRDNAPRGEPIHRGQLSFETKVGEQLRCSDSCMVVVGASSQSCLLHVLRPVEGLVQIGAGAVADRKTGAAPAPLSARQRQILRLLAEGRETGEISELLGISASTTRNHIHAVLTRLQVHSRLQAIALARRIGLL